MNEVTTESQATAPVAPVTSELTEAQATQYLLKIAELTARRAEIAAIVEKRVANLTQEMAEYSAEIAFLEDSVKGFVKTRAKSLKGAFFDVIYSKGKSSWDTKGLDGYAVTHPEILQFKKTGEPSTSLRAVKVTKQIDV
jgi:hypothetical protein